MYIKRSKLFLKQEREKGGEGGNQEKRMEGRKGERMEGRKGKRVEGGNGRT